MPFVFAVKIGLHTKRKLFRKFRYVGKRKYLLFFPESFLCVLLFSWKIVRFLLGISLNKLWILKIIVFSLDDGDITQKTQILEIFRHTDTNTDAHTHTQYITKSQFNLKFKVVTKTFPMVFSLISGDDE